MTPAKQIEKSRETMEIYAPIAHRLGISKIKVELDDLIHAISGCRMFIMIWLKRLTLNKAGREAFIDSIIVNEVGMHIKQCGHRSRRLTDVSSISSAFTEKMVNQNKTLDQIYDLFAVRIIVDTVSRTVMRHSVSFMKCTSRSRDVSRIILPCRSRICISLCIRH